MKQKKNMFPNSIIPLKTMKLPIKTPLFTPFCPCMYTPK